MSASGFCSYLYRPDLLCPCYPIMHYSFPFCLIIDRAAFCCFRNCSLQGDEPAVTSIAPPTQPSGRSFQAACHAVLTAVLGPAVKTVLSPAVTAVLSLAVKGELSPAVKTVPGPAVKATLSPAVKPVLSPADKTAPSSAGIAMESPVAKAVLSPAVKAVQSSAVTAAPNYLCHVAALPF